MCVMVVSTKQALDEREEAARKDLDKARQTGRQTAPHEIDGTDPHTGGRIDRHSGLVWCGACLQLRAEAEEWRSQVLVKDKMLEDQNHTIRGQSVSQPARAAAGGVVSGR